MRQFTPDPAIFARIACKEITTDHKLRESLVVIDLTFD